MSYNVYKRTGSRLGLVAELVDYRTAEIYKEILNERAIIKDSANECHKPMPEDSELSETYGVSDSRVMESASILFACIGAGALLLILALAIQL